MATVFKVRVPGSTSNCGAGFDTLGLGLQIYNTVTLRVVSSGEDGPQPLRQSDARAAEMVARVCHEFEAGGHAVPARFTYQIDGDVPVSRGLGSSITVLAGTLGGLNAAAGSPLSDLEQVKILTRIEGHPDNATASFWGGFCVSRCGASVADFVDLVRIEIPDSLKFVVVSPSTEIATHGSRQVLPTQISHGDAVRSVNSAAFLTAAITSGNFAKLRGAVEDFLHEPYRLPDITGAAAAIKAGTRAGALTGWLSGSGSSVLCVAEPHYAEAAGLAMQQAFADAGTDAAIHILAADNQGIVVTSE
jgi:homoserine kinase